MKFQTTTTMSKKKLVISSGAGISAESGIKTFRDADGLWENYPVMDVASHEGFLRNPALIHKFYNERREQLVNAQPNAAHLGLVELEKDFDVRVITQNVDDLHERAGSSNVLHLHGELMKVRSLAPTSSSSARQCPIWKLLPSWRMTPTSLSLSALRWWFIPLQHSSSM